MPFNQIFNAWFTAYQFVQNADQFITQINQFIQNHVNPSIYDNFNLNQLQNVRQQIGDRIALLDQKRNQIIQTRDNINQVRQQNVNNPALTPVCSNKLLIVSGSCQTIIERIDEKRALMQNRFNLFNNEILFVFAQFQEC